MYATIHFAPDDLDYTDPTLKFKTLVRADDYTVSLGPDRDELCCNCGWNTRNQEESSYGSRVRIIHTRDNSAIWTIGTQWILRDQPRDRFLGNNYITLKFLHEQRGLNIPIPQEIRRLGKPTDPIQFTLESRVPGNPLRGFWPTLSQEEKAGYSRQIVDFLRQLRQFTAPRPQKVDGSQLDDVFLAECSSNQPGNCFKIGYSADEWLDNLGPDLRMGLSKIHKTVDPVVIEEKFQELKASFPSCEPYVLTHGDLNLSNIIAKDGKIQGIVDWERAGYYPWWMEQQLFWKQGDSYMLELLGPVWEELMPEFDPPELIAKKIFPAAKAFGYCDHEHLGIGKGWSKPPFCKCRPVQGGFSAKDWGTPLSCKITGLRAEQEALLEGYKRKDPWAEDAHVPPVEE
ncbi:hypothetical protein LTS17_004153 [Exophiala oligosperma]